MPSPVLVGDAGGTNVRFALASSTADGIQIEACERFPNDLFGDFEAAVAAYLDGLDSVPGCALFALAGPVRNGCVEMTNRNWTVSSDMLQSRFGFQSVRLVNDYAAMARSIPELPQTAFETIIDGTQAAGVPIWVGGPGTGFGMATLIPNLNGAWHVMTGEGGHIAFAPQTEREFALMQHLKEEWDYVSLELVTSGMGLAAVHKALCALEGVAYEPLDAKAMLEAAANGDTICQKICRLRARAVMGAAGGFVLANGAKGGAVLTGGVSQRLAPYLREAESVSRFGARGPRSAYMANVPVRLLKQDLAPLIGAAALHFEAASIL